LGWLAPWRGRAEMWVVYSGAPPQLTREEGRGIPMLRVPAPNQELVRSLYPILGRFRRPPEVRLEDDAVLHEQVLALDEGRDLEKGKRLLAQFASQFVEWPAVTVAKLAQGLSGARVFRIAGESEYVLKLVRARDRWKIEAEIAQHAKIPGNTSNVKRHVPGLLPAHYATGPAGYLVEAGEWCAICYDFLGGKAFGPLIDLHTALTASREALRLQANADVNAYRCQCLDHVLSWLCVNWYGLAVRKSKDIWDTSDGADRVYPTYPPYQLAARNKAYILNFLASEEANLLGPRLIADWETHKERVWDFISGVSHPRGLKGKLAMVLGPAHGDLNAHNVFLWENHLEHPFLIDFPMFQECGHALQDFARLEVEIKYQLLDQQTGTDRHDLPALSWTFSKLPVWQGLERHLQSAAWEEDFVCRGAGCKENVRTAFCLIRDIRQKARTVQQGRYDDPRRAEFPHEYRIPVLFHTLRFIGYSVPIFKRLFAVCSASEMLQQLT